MKLFKFPLESMRTIRKQKEQVAQQQYARALVACAEADTQLQRAKLTLAAAWEMLECELGSGALASSILSRRAWCTTLEKRRDELQTARDAAQRAAEAAFRELVTAMREREALDRFRDKSRRAHARSVQREEQKNFDELAVQMNGANDLLQLAGHTY